MSQALPISDDLRRANYAEQTTNLTSAQRRRMKHKANGYAVKLARRGVKT